MKIKKKSQNNSSDTDVADLTLMLRETKYINAIKDMLDTSPIGNKYNIFNAALEINNYGDVRHDISLILQKKDNAKILIEYLFSFSNDHRKKDYNGTNTDVIPSFANEDKFNSKITKQFLQDFITIDLQVSNIEKSIPEDRDGMTVEHIELKLNTKKVLIKTSTKIDNKKVSHTRRDYIYNYPNYQTIIKFDDLIKTVKRHNNKTSDFGMSIKTLFADTVATVTFDASSLVSIKLNGGIFFLDPNDKNVEEKKNALKILASLP